MAIILATYERKGYINTIENLQNAVCSFINPLRIFVKEDYQSR